MLGASFTAESGRLWSLGRRPLPGRPVVNPWGHPHSLVQRPQRAEDSKPKLQASESPQGLCPELISSSLLRAGPATLPWVRKCRSALVPVGQNQGIKVKTNKTKHQPATCQRSESIWPDIHMSQNQMQLMHQVHPLVWMSCAVAYSRNKDKQTMTKHKRSNRAESMRGVWVSI